MKKLLLSCLCLLGTASLATATDATFDFTTLYGSATISDISSQSKTVSGVTISFTKGNSSTSPAYNKSGEVRLYGGSSATKMDGNTMTVAAPTGENVTSITLNAGSSCTWGTLTVNSGDLTVDDNHTVTWSGEASSVVFTLSRNASDASKSTQWRIKSAKVVAAAAGNPDKSSADLKFAETSFDVALGDEFTAPELTKATTATVAYSSDNEAVATVDATTGAVTIVGAGTVVITATAEENTDFNAGSASYTINVMKKVASIAEMMSLYGDTEKGKSSEAFIVGFEPVVIYVNGANNYVSDGTDYTLVYKYDLGLAAGDKIAAGWTATLKNYNELLELEPASDITTNGTGEIPAPKKIIAADLTAENQSMYVLLEDVEFAAATPGETATGSARGYTGTFDNTEVNFFNNFKSASVEAGKYDVTGFISVFNTTVQVAPVKFEKRSTAIDAIEAETNAPAEYYNLQGVRVSGDEPGIYVVRQGGKVTKIVK